MASEELGLVRAKAVQFELDGLASGPRSMEADNLAGRGGTVHILEPHPPLLRREATIIGDPWKGTSQALRQLSGTSRHGHRCSLPGGLRACQLGLMPRGPRSASLRLTSLAPDEQRPPTSPLSPFPVLPDINATEGCEPCSYDDKMIAQKSAVSLPWPENTVDAYSKDLAETPAPPGKDVSDSPETQAEEVGTAAVNAAEAEDEDDHMDIDSMAGRASPTGEELPADISRSSRILSGSLDALPPQHSRTIRMFISSTIDMHKEREILAKHAYPRLRQICWDLGLSFQAVDLRQGLPETSEPDPAIIDLHLREIQKCQRLSLGPTFVCLLGNVCGDSCIPLRFWVEDFLILKEVAKSKDLDPTGILDIWYIKDNISPVYAHKLQPLMDMSEEDKWDKSEVASRREAWRTWCASSASAELQRILWEAANIAHADGKLTDEKLKEYFSSVIERELQEGLLKSESPSQHCLVYGHTDTEDGKSQVQGSFPGDNIGREPVNSNTARKESFDDLKHETIPGCLVEDNIWLFSPKGTDGEMTIGVGPAPEYLLEFAERFVSDVRRLIYDAKQQQEAQNGDIASSLCAEVLHHAHISQINSDVVCRDDIMDTIREYWQDKIKKQRPLILHSEESCGKTSLIAAVHRAIPQWFGSQCVSMVRYLGSSCKSCSIQTLLESVCRHICSLYNLSVPSQEDLSTVFKLVMFFHKLLTDLGNSHQVIDKPLFILLDSLEQLEPTEYAHNFFWFPKCCPFNVHMIASMNTSDNDLLGNLQMVLHNNDCFIKIQNISDESKLIKKSMDRECCCIQPQLQRTHITKSLLLNSSLIIMEAKLDQNLVWKFGNDLTRNANTAIASVFRGLEDEYGLVLVKFALSYITVAKCGLTEVELEAALSCNHEVLQEVHSDRTQATEGANDRLPMLPWMRLLYDLKDYLMDSETSESRLLWKHQLFTKAVHKEYLNVNHPGFLHRVHEDLAGVFSTKCGTSVANLPLDGLRISGADDIQRGNLMPSIVRVLEDVPIHLLNSAISDRALCKLKESVYGNLKWLMTKLGCLGITRLCSGFQAAIGILDKETKLLVESLKLAGPALVPGRDAIDLAVEILSRIPAMGAKYELLATVVRQAREELAGYNYPIMIPLYPCLPPPGGALRGEINASPTMLQISQDNRYGLLDSKEHGICAFSVEDGSIMYVIEGKQDFFSTSQGRLDNSVTANKYGCTKKIQSLWALAPSGEHIVKSDGHNISVWKVKSGAEVKTFNPFGKLPNIKLDVFGLPPDLTLLEVDRDATMLLCVKDKKTLVKIDVKSEKVVLEMGVKDVNLERKVKEKSQCRDKNAMDDKRDQKQELEKKLPAPGHTGQISNIFLVEGSSMVLSCDRQRLCIWNIMSGALTHTIQDAGDMDQWSISEDEQVLAGHQNKRIIIIDLVQHRILASTDSLSEVLPHDAPCLTKDGKYFLANVANNSIRLYKVTSTALATNSSTVDRFSGAPNLTLIRDLEYAHRKCGLSFLFFDRAEQFAIGGGPNGTVSIWHLPSQELITNLQVSSSIAVGKLVITPSSHALYTFGTNDSTFKVWDLETTLMQARRRHLKYIVDVKIRSFEAREVAVWLSKQEGGYVSHKNDSLCSQSTPKSHSSGAEICDFVLSKSSRGGNGTESVQSGGLCPDGSDPQNRSYGQRSGNVDCSEDSGRNKEYNEDHRHVMEDEDSESNTGGGRAKDNGIICCDGEKDNAGIDSEAQHYTEDETCQEEQASALKECEGSKSGYCKDNDYIGKESSSENEGCDQPNYYRGVDDDDRERDRVEREEEQDKPIEDADEYDSENGLREGKDLLGKTALLEQGGESLNEGMVIDLTVSTVVDAEKESECRKVAGTADAIEKDLMNQGQEDNQGDTVGKKMVTVGGMKRQRNGKHVEEENSRLTVGVELSSEDCAKSGIDEKHEVESSQEEQSSSTEKNCKRTDPGIHSLVEDQNDVKTVDPQLQCDHPQSEEISSSNSAKTGEDKHLIISSANVDCVQSVEQRFPQHDMNVSSVQLTADGRYAVTLLTNGTVFVWSTQDGSFTREFPLQFHGKKIQQALKSHILIHQEECTGQTHSLQMFDLENGTCHALSVDKGQPVETMAITPDGTNMLCLQRAQSCGKTCIRNIDLLEKKCKSCAYFEAACDISAHSVHGQYMECTADQHFVVTCLDNQWDGSVTYVVYDLEKAAMSEDDVRVHSIRNHPMMQNLEQGKEIIGNEERGASQTTTVSLGVTEGISSSENKLDSVSEGMCVFGNTNAHRTSETPVENDKCLMDTEVSMPGQMRDTDNHLSCTKPKSIKFDADLSNSITAILSNSEAVTGNRKGELVIWSLETCEVLRTLSAATRHDLPAHKLKQEEEGTYKSENSKIESIPDADSLVLPHQGTVTCVKLSMDRSLLVAGSEDKTLTVWDVREARMRHRLSGHENKVLCCAVSGVDGGYILSGSTDHTIRLWRGDSGTQLCLFHAHMEISDVHINLERSVVIARGGKEGSCRVVMLKMKNVTEKLMTNDTTLLQDGNKQ